MTVNVQVFCLRQIYVSIFDMVQDRAMACVADNLIQFFNRFKFATEVLPNNAADVLSAAASRASTVKPVIPAVIQRGFGKFDLSVQPVSHFLFANLEIRRKMISVHASVTAKKIINPKIPKKLLTRRSRSRWGTSVCCWCWTTASTCSTPAPSWSLRCWPPVPICACWSPVEKRWASAGNWPGVCHR